MAKKISIEQAENLMLDKLAKEDMGERIYDFAQELYQQYIREIEDKYRVENPNVLDRYEKWYDGIYEEFFQTVYDTALSYLSKRE